MTPMRCCPSPSSDCSQSKTYRSTLGPRKRLLHASKRHFRHSNAAPTSRNQAIRPGRARSFETDAADDISDLDANASWRAPAFEQTYEHPVVCVSWHDARNYVAWLSRKTGQDYRLPSEAEWEYAARAGTTSAFFWGASADRDCVHMNGGDRSLVRAVPSWPQTVAKALRDDDPRARLVECDDGSPFTSVVGRYEPNAFGLRDIIGNVWEWVEDCWSESLPKDNLPQTGDACDRRTRGGSWDDFPEDLRAARRSRLAPEIRRSDVGFRLARALTRS